MKKDLHNVLTHGILRCDSNGADISLEDGSGKILLEDATMLEDIHRFLTERSVELFGIFLSRKQSR